MIALRRSLFWVLSFSWCLLATAAHADEPRDSKVLEATMIEGQILFPKVLFISAEDQARYPETLHRAYLRTPLEIASATPAPKTICTPEVVNASPPAGADGTLPAGALPEPANAASPSNSQEVNP
jgi:hypothetical protein